jgi:hypothetical protein
VHGRAQLKTDRNLAAQGFNSGAGNGLSVNPEPTSAAVSLTRLLTSSLFAGSAVHSRDAGLTAVSRSA